MKVFILVVCCVWLASLAYGLLRPLPPGLALEGRVHTVPWLNFFYDITYLKNDNRVSEQAIFEQILAQIAQAERFVILDMFLFNDVYGRRQNYPPVADRLAAALIAKRQDSPTVSIAVITDEINTFYGSHRDKRLESLKDHGVKVIFTEMSKLKDSNFFYSAFWRPLRWFGTAGSGWLPNPFSPDAPRWTLRSYLKMLNFKANHRKVLVTDKAALVTSANAHDASAFHSNIAFVVPGNIVADIAAAEAAVAKFSGGFIQYEAPAETVESGPVQVRFLTEGAIKKYLLAAIEQSSPGDAIWMAMFYLSENDIVRSLLDAERRGVTVRLLLDPNKDAFGRPKNGIPNRQVAKRLVDKSGGRIRVRWYNTHGEQFHAKLVMVSGREKSIILGGSANITRRNIDNFNLEACLWIEAFNDAKIVREVNRYFERIWRNQDGRYSVAYDVYQERSFVKELLAGFQEWSGMGTF